MVTFPFLKPVPSYFEKPEFIFYFSIYQNWQKWECNTDGL